MRPGSNRGWLPPADGGPNGASTAGCPDLPPVPRFGAQPIDGRRLRAVSGDAAISVPSRTGSIRAQDHPTAQDGWGANRSVPDCRLSPRFRGRNTLARSGSHARGPTAQRGGLRHAATSRQSQAGVPSFPNLLRACAADTCGPHRSTSQGRPAEHRGHASDRDRELTGGLPAAWPTYQSPTQWRAPVPVCAVPQVPSCVFRNPSAWPPASFAVQRRRFPNRYRADFAQFARRQRYSSGCSSRRTRNRRQADRLP